MEIKKSFTVDAPIDKVWHHLATEFGQAHAWCTGLYHSEAYNAPTLPGAPAANRACDTNQGKIKEVIETFDPANYHLAYSVIEGFPGFVKSGTNNWRLTPQGDTTRVDIHFVAELQGLVGTLMQPMMGWQLGKVLEAAGQDFKHYVETGRPSAAKARELAKRKRAA